MLIRNPAASFAENSASEQRVRAEQLQQHCVLGQKGRMLSSDSCCVFASPQSCLSCQCSRAQPSLGDTGLMLIMDPWGFDHSKSPSTGPCLAATEQHEGHEASSHMRQDAHHGVERFPGSPWLQPRRWMLTSQETLANSTTSSRIPLC